MISPGVYTNIIDLSTYLTSTSGTIGFVPIITEKGEDNVLKRVTSFEEYVQNFGEPDIRTFGKYYGCGPYIATQHLSVSSDLYVIRALPDDATYAHAYIYFGLDDNYPEKYKFDVQYRKVTGSTAKQAAMKYDGQHVALASFSVQPNIPYGLQSDIKCWAYEVESVPAWTINPNMKQAAYEGGAGYTLCGYKANSLDQIALTTDKQFANKYYEIFMKPYPEGATLQEKAQLDTENNTFKVRCAQAGKAFDSKFKPINKDTKINVIHATATYTNDLEFADYTLSANGCGCDNANPEKVYEPKYNETLAYTPKYKMINNDNGDRVFCCTKESNQKEAVRTHCGFRLVTVDDVSIGVPTDKYDEVTLTTDEFYADVNSTKDPIPSNQTVRQPILIKTKKTYAVDPDKIQDAFDNYSLFGEDGYPLSTADANAGVLTTIEDFAKKAYAPKMSSTQLLDSLFYGNDTLVVAAIDDCRGKEIYSGVNIDPHDCVLAYVRAVGRGSYYNALSIKITSDANPASFGTYKFQIFELQDGAEALCESYNISFDPTALDSDGDSMYFVDVINKFSSRIVVEANENSLKIIQDTLHDFYDNDPTIVDITDEYIIDTSSADETAKTWPVKVPYYDTNPYSETYGTVVVPSTQGYRLGYKAKAIWEAYYAKAWAEYQNEAAQLEYQVAVDMDDDDINKEDAIDAAIDSVNVAQDMKSDAADMYTWATTRNLLNMNDSDNIVIGEQPYYLQYGSLGSLINKKGVVNAQVGNQILCKAYTGLLKNPVTVKKVDESTGNIWYSTKYTDNVYDLDWIYFTIVYDPGYKSDVKASALNLVDTYRRDCVLISDCGDNSNYEDCLKYVGAVEGGVDVRPWNTYLAARYEPYSRVYDVYTGKDIWVSPVYHMAKLIPQTDKLYDLWYAAAGFTRGQCTDVKELRYSVNKTQRDLFYMAQVNPIVHFPEGMTVWGNLTTQKKNSTLSDLNCVRCVLYIKRALEQYCKNFIFELNNAGTWSTIYSGIAPMLDTIVQRGGLRSYTLDVGATEYELKTKVCHVNVTLEPTKVLEKIQINMYIQ